MSTIADLEKKSYGEYLYNKLIRECSSQNAKLFQIRDIVPILIEVLENEYAIQYLYDNSHLNKICNAVTVLYKYIIIDNKKNFIKLDKIDDLALSILFTLYH